MTRIFVLMALLLVILSGCESTPQRDNDGLIDIIPTKEKDSGPSRPVDLSQLPDAVPRKEKRTLAGNKSPYKVKGIVYHVMNDGRGYQQEGIASWYGRKFHGNTTSNGEIYNMYAMTGAHKTLPIPAYVQVENLENNRKVIVRINDRGPFAKGRIIDLSYAAAQKLGYADSGTSRVRVTYIDTSSNALSSASNPDLPLELPTAGSDYNGQNLDTPQGVLEPQFYLQTGAFKSEAIAIEQQQSISKHTVWPVRIERAPTGQGNMMHRVQIGPFPNPETLEIMQRTLVEKGLGESVRVLR